MTNQEHKMTCDLCGQEFDLRSLTEVIEHFHTNSTVKIDPDIKGVRVFTPEDDQGKTRK